MLPDSKSWLQSPFSGWVVSLVTLMGGGQAGNLIVFDLIRLSSPEQIGYYTLGKALGTFLMLATAQPSAPSTACQTIWKALLWRRRLPISLFFLSPSPGPLSLPKMAGHHHNTNNTHLMHHPLNNTQPIFIPKRIVEEHGTESALWRKLHSPDSADLPRFSALYRRNSAEIRPYSRWRIYVSLDIRYFARSCPFGYIHILCRRWEFLSTIWFEWSFISRKRPYRWSVWVSKLTGHLTCPLYMSLSETITWTLGLWGDTHSHTGERAGQPDSERLEGFDRLSGMVIFWIRAHRFLKSLQNFV